MIRVIPALAMFEAFAETRPIEHEGAPDSTFVYLSAEDIFRPFVPARYIATKREAEATIMRRVGELQRLKHRAIRPILVRPSEFPPSARCSRVYEKQETDNTTNKNHRSNLSSPHQPTFNPPGNPPPSLLEYPIHPPNNPTNRQPFPSNDVSHF